MITGTRNLKGKIILIAFKNCLVRHKEEVLFQPDWGIYHLAVGKKVLSAFAGPADINSFDLLEHTLSSSTKAVQKSTLQLELEQLYQQVRAVRSEKLTTEVLKEIIPKVLKKHPNEWLLLLEIYELLHPSHSSLTEQIQSALQQIIVVDPTKATLIEEGLKLFNSPYRV